MDPLYCSPCCWSALPLGYLAWSLLSVDRKVAARHPGDARARARTTAERTEQKRRQACWSGSATG